MFQMDLATYKVGPQCGMRRPTFTFGGGESPYYGAKSRRSNNGPAANGGAGSSGSVSAGIASTNDQQHQKQNHQIRPGVNGSKQTTNGNPNNDLSPNATRFSLNQTPVKNDVQLSTSSLASVTSSPASPTSSSSASVTSVCDTLNSKNKFYSFLNGGGGGVMLVPAPLIIGAPGGSEDCLKPRKRKERQDSLSSITQERKLVRSNSEERPTAANSGGAKEEEDCQKGSSAGGGGGGSDIRRVVSHEDFLPLHEHNAAATKRAPGAHHNNHLHGGHHGGQQQTQQSVVRDPSPMKHGGKAFSEEFPRCDFLHKYRKNDSSPARSRLNDFSQKLRASPDRSNYCEDGEHERRRHTERFSRARVPQGSRKANGGLKSRRSQRTPRQSSNIAQDENQNPRPILQQDQEPIQRETETDLQTEAEHTPFPWSEPCDSRPMPSPHAENFRTRKCHSNDINISYEQDLTVPATSICRAKKSDDSHDVVRMTECHAKQYEFHSKALSEGNNDAKGKSSIPVESTETIYYIAPEERLKQISKKLSGLKKRIAKYEESFENQNGYRISQVDKMADKGMKKIYGEIQKLRKEKMRLKIDPVSAMVNYNKEVMRRMDDAIENDVLQNRLDKIKHTLIEIEKRLQEKRDKCDRPLDLEQMSPSQLADEKVALQKALLYLEAQFGRPSTRDERDVAHPLYDRYRQVKRLVLRTNVSKLNSSVSELETILEHETMDFVSSEMSSQPSNTSLSQKIMDTNFDAQECTAITTRGTYHIPVRLESSHMDKLASPNRSIDESPPSLNSTDSNSTSTSSVHENLHNLPLDELKLQLTATHEEKKHLRRSIKEFEHNFETNAGRRIQKEDRVDMESTYGLYKQIKAKLRLLEALVNKQKHK